MAKIAPCKCCGISACNQNFCNDCAQMISDMVFASTIPQEGESKGKAKLLKFMRGILFKEVKERVIQIRKVRNYPTF